MAQLSDSFKSSNSFQTPPSTYKSPQAEVAKVEELLPGTPTFPFKAGEIIGVRVLNQSLVHL